MAVNYRNIVNAHFLISYLHKMISRRSEMRFRLAKLVSIFRIRFQLGIRLRYPTEPFSVESSNRYEYRIKKLYIIVNLRIFIELCLKKTHFIYHEIRVLRNKTVSKQIYMWLFKKTVFSYGFQPAPTSRDAIPP